MEKPPSPQKVIEYLADPESWLGGPHDQKAVLLGHFTPYELARLCLGLDPNCRAK